MGVGVSDGRFFSFKSDWMEFQQSQGANMRSAADKLRERVSVKDFGAVGNADPFSGSGTDDHAAIQAALYSTGSTGDRQLSVFFPDGTYYSSENIIIPEGVTVHGNGAWRTKVHFAAGKGFRMASGGTYDFPPELRDIAVYSSGGAGLTIESISGASVHDVWFSGTTGIEIQGTADIAIHDNVFDGTANGIVFTAGSLCNNISIQNNSFTGNAYGITLKNARDVRITGNAFRGDANHNIHILSNNDSNTLIGVVISGNTFYTAPATGAAGSLLMKLNGTLSNVSITGNTMDGCRAQGIYCDQGNVNGVLIADNIISNTGSDAITFTNTGTQVSIKGNIFRASIGGKALNYNVAGICTFMGNEVYSANVSALAGLDGAAVDVQQATHFVARGNTIINATMTYGFSIRSTVVLENAHDNIISGATVGEYSIANNSWAPMKLTGPLNPGTIGAGTQPNGIWAGNGVPSNSFGINGDWYMRTGTPGTANQRLYVKNAGTWAGVL